MVSTSYNNEIYTDIFEFAQNNNAINKKGHERQEELSTRVQGIAKKIGMDPDNIIVERNDGNPLHDFGASALYDDEMNQRVIISYLFLIKASDIPKDLQLNSIHDFRLLSTSYLNRVIDWMQNFLGTDLPRGRQSNTAIQLFLMLATDPIKYEKAKFFILAHEIGHLFHKHMIKKIEKITPNIWKTVLTSSAVVFPISCVLKAYSFSNSIVSGLGAMAAILTYKVAKTFFTSSLSYAHEKEADSIAKQVGYADGGIYFFKTCREHQLMIKNSARTLGEKISMWMTIDRLGNDYGGIWTHPLFSDREKQLKT